MTRVSKRIALRRGEDEDEDAKPNVTLRERREGLHGDKKRGVGEPNDNKADVAGVKEKPRNKL